MKQNVVDVLMFLFENYIGDDTEIENDEPIRDSVQILFQS